VSQFTEVLPATQSSPHTAIRWTPDPDATGRGELVIHTARASTAYAVAEFGTPWEGRAFLLTRREPDAGGAAVSYNVFCHRGRQDNLCDCRGFARHGNCKHVSACFALIENQWLDLPPANAAETPGSPF
jgi:hypothetical protein